MMTMTRIGASRDAWGYLLNTVVDAQGEERAHSKSSYYTGDGTPPGSWIGQGAATLGLTAAHPASESELKALFGEGAHPVTKVPLGRGFDVSTSLEERVQARLTQVLTEASEHIASVDVDKLATEITQEELQKPQKESVAGFEFVFSPPKSVSSWWAIADPDLKSTIQEAHSAAIASAVAMLETDVVRTRTGMQGIAQVETSGITAALFDHWDSREGDPQLHTHMLLSNKVQAADGKWRTIDSRALYPAVSTAGAHYDTVLMDELSQRLGADWTTQDVLEHPQEYQAWLSRQRRVDSPAGRFQFSLDRGTKRGSIKWQLAGIPHSLNAEFSQRSEAIREAKEKRIADYVAKHGHAPSPQQIIKFRQQATLSTRGAKIIHSLKDLTQSWRQRAKPHIGDSFLAADRLVKEGEKRLADYPLWSFRQDDISIEDEEEAASFALSVLAEERSTWRRTNAEKAVYDATAHWRFRSDADRRETVKRITERVLSKAVPLTPTNTRRTPTRFQTQDGATHFQPTAHDLYTTTEVWDAEERLLEAGRRTDWITVDEQIVTGLITAPTGEEQLILSADQSEAVTNITQSGRLVDVLVGPAGAGKTTSLEKLREIWETQYGPGSVRGLAPTARAAEVLAESLGIATENTAKWLHETNQGTSSREGFNYSLNAGDLLIVDEASIAGTIALDTLRSQAEEAGAKLLLVGDWAQLAAIDAGGAFGLLAADRPDVAELSSIHRFKADWEADASRLLRLGRSDGLEAYIENDRIEWGLDETIITAAVDAWKHDETTPKSDSDATLTSLLIAPTNDMVERLNDIARQWRVSIGAVDASETAEIASGVASPGDRIVTRQNARHLKTDHDRWVKNNDEWVIKAVDQKTGDITVSSGEETVTLPASYCREHVQLAYATTAHRSQGRTVDTAHTIVDSSASRETFYVSMTRGKALNKAYVIIDEEGALGEKQNTGMVKTWREVLDGVLKQRGGDLAAHDTQKLEAERLGSITQLYAEYQTLMSHAFAEEWLDVLKQLNVATDESIDLPSLGPLMANMSRIEKLGYDVPETLNNLLTTREISSSHDPLSVLHWRTKQFVDAAAENSLHGHRFAPLLDQFDIQFNEGTTHLQERRFYRSLELLERSGRDAEEELREILLTTDRASIANLTTYLSSRINRLGVSDEHGSLGSLKSHANVQLKVAGLLDVAPQVRDNDFLAALKDREEAIQLRAELILDTAIAEDQPWVKALGEPLPGGEAQWRQDAVRVACYRDLYGVDSHHLVGAPEPQNHVRTEHRNMAFAPFRDSFEAVRQQQSTAGHFIHEEQQSRQLRY
ncbi:relaxase domain-containing protein [Leucobacter sp. UCMA 4100]|uniref:MobF family relaxase n=1 Tax=Leucobacter sp. UCMA 4100 TaxID=2810534 RepID=UPI0022EB9867|nr:MobF family relaxase [Leucobacter sp. UCMA 4100]MDA3146505.1 relaxase domain-containing protein [Leucobacter sp. UCMA 4100]